MLSQYVDISDASSSPPVDNTLDFLSHETSSQPNQPKTAVIQIPSPLTELDAFTTTHTPVNSFYIPTPGKSTETGVATKTHTTVSKFNIAIPGKSTEKNETGVCSLYDPTSIITFDTSIQIDHLESILPQASKTETTKPNTTNDMQIASTMQKKPPSTTTTTNTHESKS